MSKSDDDELVGTYGVAACFSADEDGTVRLPFDLSTGRLIPEVWERWLAWDPVRMVADHADALRGMRAIYLDAGRRDDYHLDLGAEAMRRELAANGVDDVHFELFDGSHSAIDTATRSASCTWLNGSRSDGSEVVTQQHIASSAARGPAPPQQAPCRPTHQPAVRDSSS